jgi:hypothetical protein
MTNLWQGLKENITMDIPLSCAYQFKGHLSGAFGVEGYFMWVGAKKTTYQARDHSKQLSGTGTYRRNNKCP